MLNIKVLCVGKIKESSVKDLIDEYSKRISKYAKLEIIEVEDEKINSTNSDIEIEKVKTLECEKLLNKLEKIGKCTIFVLDLKGKQYTSQEFAKEIENISTYEASTIVFVIGGSLGMTDNFINKANKIICFSKMTFPHQLIRVFLLEQVFRAFKILNNETYHH